jgi:DNA-binding MurR/RpiR family transcriptional regulator
MIEKNHDIGDLSERIRQATGRLGDGARSVAELVLSRPEEVALLPAAKVAEQLGISESTVVRFATAIGFDGYPALRRALQDRVRRHLDPTQRLERYAGRLKGRGAGTQSLLTDLDDLAATERDLPPAALADAVDRISEARQIYILGLRGSYGLAYTLYHYLNQTLRSVRLMEPGRGEAIEQLAHLDGRDLLIAISFPRYTRLTVQAMRLAAERGVGLIAITDGPLSPLAEHAAVTLSARCSSKAYANSNVGALGIINALVAEVAVKNRKQSIQSLARLETILQNAGVIYEDDRVRRSAAGEAK